jgi:hypothetical protein
MIDEEAADAERELRIDLMKTQIDQGRVNIDKMRQEMRWEPYKALAAIVAAAAAISGIILGVAHLLH